MAKWGWLLKVRAVLSKIADVAIWGRGKGWWQDGGGPSIGGPKQ